MENHIQQFFFVWFIVCLVYRDEYKSLSLAVDIIQFGRLIENIAHGDLFSIPFMMK